MNSCTHNCNFMVIFVTLYIWDFFICDITEQRIIICEKEEKKFFKYE